MFTSRLALDMATEEMGTYTGQEQRPLVDTGRVNFGPDYYNLPCPL